MIGQLLMVYYASGKIAILQQFDLKSYFTLFYEVINAQFNEFFLYFRLIGLAIDAYDGNKLLNGNNIKR